MILVRRREDGTYWARSSCGAACVYEGEDAEILDLLFKYQKESDNNQFDGEHKYGRMR